MNKKRYIMFFGGSFAFICFIIGILSITLNYMKLSREGIFHELEDQMNKGSKHLNFYFESLCSDLIGIEDYLTKRDIKAGEELHGYLDFVTHHHPNSIRAICILGANGNVVASTDPSLVKSSFRESKYFKCTRRSEKKVYFSEVIALSDFPAYSKAASTDVLRPLDLGFVLYTGVYYRAIFKGAVLFFLRGEPFFNRYSMAIKKFTSGYGFILQRNGRILFHRDVELRGRFLSDLPDSSKMAKFGDLLEKAGGKTPGRFIIGNNIIVLSKTTLENQEWVIGISTTGSEISQKTRNFVYILIWLVLLLGMIIFGLVFSLLRLDKTKEDLRQSEAELRRHRDHLEEVVAERTAQLKSTNKELEDFAYSVSHDLRAPLRSISGFANIISRRHSADLNEEGRHYLDNIMRASEHMGILIEDLLRYSRLGRKVLRSQPVRLDELLEQISRDLAGCIDEVGAEITIADGLPVVKGDPALLNTIFTNLIDNALTYHREGTPPRLAVGSRVEKGQVIVSVSDNGIGIAPEFHEKIFNMFQRLHSQEDYPGTGIGLAIVKKSVELLDGSVWVESVVGEGSTFYVKLKGIVD